MDVLLNPPHSRLTIHSLPFLSTPLDAAGVGGLVGFAVTGALVGFCASPQLTHSASTATSSSANLAILLALASLSPLSTAIRVYCLPHYPWGGPWLYRVPRRNANGAGGYTALLRPDLRSVTLRGRGRGIRADGACVSHPSWSGGRAESAADIGQAYLNGSLFEQSEFDDANTSRRPTSHQASRSFAAGG